jgi:hypothetical protein
VHNLTEKLFPQGHDAKHAVAKHFLSLSDACSNASPLFKSVLFGSGTPN